MYEVKSLTHAGAFKEVCEHLKPTMPLHVIGGPVQVFRLKASAKPRGIKGIITAQVFLAANDKNWQAKLQTFLYECGKIINLTVEQIPMVKEWSA